jgi:eukaryotic-like serine/threonine-protein kinase
MSAHSVTDDLFDEAAAEYFQAWERGERIDREAFVNKYSEIADALTAAFIGGDLLDDVLTPIQAAIPAETPPVSLGDLEVAEEIGRGGMGVVYRATQRSLGRAVAVKRIQLSDATAPRDIERFRFEARAAAKLSHPNILSVLTFVETADEVMMVMPLIAGGDLRKRLASGPLPPRTAAGVMIDVARGVAHAHTHGIIHRDIKPGNIMVCDDGRAVVADFGLARSLEMESGLTYTGQVLGTPSYMAPEQASAEATGPLADVYALGATLYALVIGKPPFQAESPLATMQLVCDHEPVRPRLLNPHVPADLDAVIMKCLSKSPEDRYSTATAFAADLQRFLDGEPVRAEPPSVWRRLRAAFRHRHNRERIERWSGPLVRIGVLVFVVHSLLEIAAVFSNGWLIPRLAGRGVILLALTRWLYIWRAGELGPRNSFERSLWSLWIGYLLTLPFANIGLAALGRSRGEAAAVECLLAGLGFIATGGFSWGGCYVAGFLFLLLAIPAWFVSAGVDFAFGMLWLLSLFAVSTYGASDNDRGTGRRWVSAPPGKQGE